VKLSSVHEPCEASSYFTLRRPHVAAATPALTPPVPVEQPGRRTWMKYERVQRMVGQSRLLRRLTIGALARLELWILKGHKDHATLSTIRRCRRNAESLLSGSEAFLLHSVVRAQRSLDGAMAELGVYQGSSAQIICEAKGDCPLYLFDTFAGLPEPDEDEADSLTQGQYPAKIPAVRRLLRSYSNVRIHPGMFPQSAHGIEDVRFNFVHLDADLYASILAGLEFFYPRMVPGGIIIVHDYSTINGVARATAEFFSDRSEGVIELPTTQAMIVVREPTIHTLGSDA
jgi:O-methyltransferase